MEYVDGEPLSSIIRTQAPLDADAGGVDRGRHRQGPLLRAPPRRRAPRRQARQRPHHLRRPGQGRPTSASPGRSAADEQVTQTGLVMGTATYFSPEQAQGLDVDGRSDVYSLGVVLYEMVTGRPPFTGDTPVSIAYQHVRGDRRRRRARSNPAIPRRSRGDRPAGDGQAARRALRHGRGPPRRPRALRARPDRCSHRRRQAMRAPRPLRSSPTRRCLLRNPVDRPADPGTGAGPGAARRGRPG